MQMAAEFRIRGDLPCGSTLSLTQQLDWPAGTPTGSAGSSRAGIEFARRSGCGSRVGTIRVFSTPRETARKTIAYGAPWKRIPPSLLKRAWTAKADAAATLPLEKG